MKSLKDLKSTKNFKECNKIEKIQSLQVSACNLSQQKPRDNMEWTAKEKGRKEKKANRVQQKAIECQNRNIQKNRISPRCLSDFSFCVHKKVSGHSKFEKNAFSLKYRIIF